MGGTHISFGAVKFEPGIYADYPLENGMTISPYARGELQQRFGYENTASLENATINFKDSDFSAALSTGFNLKMSKSATLTGEVRGKLSSDSSTIAGKLGIKIAF
jgi:outer membrane autotransporter protein